MGFISNLINGKTIKTRHKLENSRFELFSLRIIYERRSTSFSVQKEGEKFLFQIMDECHRVDGKFVPLYDVYKKTFTSGVYVEYLFRRLNQMGFITLCKELLRVDQMGAVLLPRENDMAIELHYNREEIDLFPNTVKQDIYQQDSTKLKILTALDEIKSFFYAVCEMKEEDKVEKESVLQELVRNMPIEGDFPDIYSQKVTNPVYVYNLFNEEKEILREGKN